MQKAVKTDGRFLYLLRYGISFFLLRPGVCGGDAVQSHESRTKPACYYGVGRRITWVRKYRGCTLRPACRLYEKAAAQTIKPCPRRRTGEGRFWQEGGFAAALA